jgi:hypothetical protein
MEDTKNQLFKHYSKNEGLAKNKNLETVANFRRKDIERAFADVDDQLKQLAEQHRQGNISKTKHLIIVQEIRNRLFELCSLAIHNMDVRRFASHEPGSKTPLNSEGR